MKKDEIIQLLMEQLDKATESNTQLLQRIDALLKHIASLEEALLQKGESIEKQKRANKGLTKIISNKSEKQTPEPLSEEKQKALEAEGKRNGRQEKTMAQSVTCIKRRR